MDCDQLGRVGQLTLRSSRRPRVRKREPAALLLDGLGDAAGLLGLAAAEACWGAGRRASRRRGPLRRRAWTARGRRRAAISRALLPSCGSDSRHRQIAIIRRGLQGRRDSNPQPPVLETGALPVELRPFAHPQRRSAASGSPCAAGECRTTCRTSGTRCDPGCSACSSWSDSSDACTLRKPSSLQCAALLPQVDDSGPGTGERAGYHRTRGLPGRRARRSGQRCGRPARRRRAAGDCAAAASARAAARSSAAAARCRSRPVCTGSGPRPAPRPSRRTGSPGAGGPWPWGSRPSGPSDTGSAPRRP